MFGNTGGGGKGIRPNQHNQQQQQQQAQQHHHHQSHHQTHHQQHQQQQAQLQSGSLHQTSSQSSGNSHSHPHQQQAAAPPPHQPQFPHHIAFYPFALNQLHQNAAGQNASANVAGSQLAPSPPTHTGGNGSQGASLAGGGAPGGGGAGGNAASNAGSGGRPGSTSNTLSHYSTGNAMMQGTLPPPSSNHFMAAPYHMQLQQQNAVMVTAQYNSSVTAASQHGNPVGGQAGAALYQTQQQAQTSATHQQAPIHYFSGSTVAAQAPTGLHHPSQHHTLRSMITTVQHPQPYFYTVPQSLPPPRSSMLTSAHQQQATGSGGTTVHVTTQLQNAGTRGTGGGPTAYVQQPFCAPPIQMGAAPPIASQTQPLLAPGSLAPSQLQSPYGHLTGATAASTSSASLNLSSASVAGGPASTGTEHTGTKPRRHAIPIINPITLEAVQVETQTKSTVPVEIKSPSEAENKPAKAVAVIMTAPPEREAAVKVIDKSSPVTMESVIAETTAHPADAAAKDKIDQQMQTDVFTDKSSTSPVPEAQIELADNTVQALSVKSAPNTGMEENDDTDADTPELEHDDDAYRGEAADSSYLQTTATTATGVTDNALSRDCGDQPPIMDSDDTDQTTETDVKSMSQMDDDANCKRLQSEDEQQQQLDVNPKLLATNTANDDKPMKIPINANSVDKSKEPSRDANEANETDDSITIQRKAVTSEDHATDKEIGVPSTKAKETSKGAKGSNSSPPALTNNVNNNNKKQTTAIDPNVQNQSINSNSDAKLDATLRGAVAPPGQYHAQANDDAFITVSNRKKNKVAAKRNAKENQKKPQHQPQSTQQQQHRAHTERSNSTTSNNSNSNKSHNNNNNNNNNNNKSPSTPPTNGQQNHINDIHNANNSPSPSNNNGSGSGSSKHQSPQTPTASSTTNNNNENVDPAVKGSPPDSKDSEINDKHVKPQEISEQFLQPASVTTPSAASKTEDQQVQFLTSSSSAGEDDEVRLKHHQQQKQPEVDADSAQQDARLGDFKENEKVPEVANKGTDQSKSRGSPDTVDFSNTQAAHGRPALSSIPSKPNKALHVVTPTIQKHQKGKQNLRYSLKDLKLLASAPESRKAPKVPCKKDDVISQLFVPRQALHNNTQAVGGMHLPQPYQHMNFHENMEFISGKRRGTQQRKHDHQTITASCGNIAGVGGPGGGAGGSTVGMTGGSVSVTGTSFARPVKMIRVNLSLNEEIKLSESENAWQPATLLAKSQASSGAGASDSVEAVVKKVRGVLNKLTPDNFDVLLKTVKSITLDTDEKMQNVMVLIFEKTVNEPNFAPTYAKFCKVLFQEVKPNGKQQFHTLLIKRIQTEYEQNVNKVDAKKMTLQPLFDKLKTCTDPMERQAIQAEIEDQEYQFRRRGWGTVRFIGELYKVNSLTGDRVLLCIESLLSHSNEEKLEYMCKLLTTVGHLLEETKELKIRLNDVFRKISEIVNNARRSGKNTNANQPKISSRVRFMMQDVMDLRARHWDQTPAHPSQSSASSVSSGGGSGNGGSNSQHQQRRRHQDEKNNRNNYDRGGSSQRMGYGGSNSQKQNRLMGQDRDGGGGGNYYSKNSQKSQYTHEGIDMKKLNFSKCDDSSQSTVELGNKNNFVWRMTGRQTGGSGGSMQNPSAVPFRGMSGFSTSQQYGSSGSNSNSAYNSMKGTSNQFHMLSTREPESDRQQSDTDRPSASQTSASSSSNEDSDGEEKSISLDAAKDYQKQINGFVEDFLDCAPTNSYGWQADALKTWRLNKLQQHVELMYFLLIDYLHLAKVNKVHRAACATIFSYLLRTKAFDKKTFAKAYDQFAKEFPEVLVDVPNGWTYVFEFLGPLLHDRLLTIDDIWRPDWRENVHFTKLFVKSFIVHFIKDFGANYIREMWHKDCKLERGQKFIADQKVWNEFIDSHGLSFLYDNNCKPPADLTSRKSALVEDHIKRMEVLLKGGTTSDLAIDYINTNVHIDNSFLERLTRFLCCDYATVMTPSSNSSSGSSSSTKKGGDESKSPQFNKEVFRKCCIPLLRRCIDAQEEYEVLCVETAFESIHEFYDYSTTIASELTRNIFDVLYDCEIISKDTFEKWYSKQKSSSGIQISPQLQDHLKHIL